MNRARDLLQERLARRGLALSTGFLFMLIAKNAGAALVSPTLVGITAKAALALAAGPVGLAGVISGQVTSLTEEVLRTTPAAGKLSKLWITLALLVLIATMGGILTYEVLGYPQGPLWGCETPAKADVQK
jgi:RNA polymerase sigma-70 factor (ECF subfamily)